MITALKQYWYDDKEVLQGSEFVAFQCEALDPDAVIWHLLVAPTGSITLRYDTCIVSSIAAQEGWAILRSDGTPSEIAEDIVVKLTSKLAVQIHEHASMSLESDLSRWIADNL